MVGGHVRYHTNHLRPQAPIMKFFPLHRFLVPFCVLLSSDRGVVLPCLVVQLTASSVVDSSHLLAKLQLQVVCSLPGCSRWVSRDENIVVAGCPLSSGEAISISQVFNGLVVIEIKYSVVVLPLNLFALPFPSDQVSIPYARSFSYLII